MNEFLLVLIVFFGISVGIGELIRQFFRCVPGVQFVAGVTLLLIAWGTHFQVITRIIVWCIGCALIRWIVHSTTCRICLTRFAVIYFCSLMIIIIVWAMLSGDIRVQMGIGIPSVVVEVFGARRLFQESDGGRGAV